VLLVVALSAVGCSGVNPPAGSADPGDSGTFGGNPDGGNGFNEFTTSPSGAASGAGTTGTTSGSPRGSSEDWADGSASESGIEERLDASRSADSTVDAANEVYEASLGAGPCADQAAWLTPMNDARAAVGEAPLLCDPIASQVALNYAEMCNWAHNANRNADYVALGGAASGVGENIAAGAPSESIAAAVASWVNEKSSYDYATNTCASGQMCGHYTQIIWKTTTAVGCAHVSCTTPIAALGGATKWDFSVCDYSPPGNYVGQRPY
jgi:hypothetical protein